MIPHVKKTTVMRYIASPYLINGAKAVSAILCILQPYDFNLRQ